MLRRPRLPPEQLLALRAAVLPGPRAYEAFAEWRQLVEFDAADAATYRLLPLIYRNLEALLGSDPVLGRLRGIYRRTWVLNAIQIQGGERAIAALGERGIPTMLLKGAAMIARWTGDSGVRMMADFDLLVPRERALEAVSCLLEAGWRPAVDRSESLTEADLGEEHAILLTNDEGGELDLHWRALMHGAVGAPDRLVWDRAQEVRLGEVSTHVQAPEDHVHHACSHATTWSSAGRVDWIADSALIIGEVGPAFSWSRLLDLARFDRSTVAVKTLTAALSEVLGVPVPPRGSRRGFGGLRPAIVERAEISLRGRLPHEIGRSAELFLDLQEHRRRTGDLLRRPLIASIPSFAKKHWRVEGVRGVAVQAAYAGLGRPRWLRRSLLRRVRSSGLDGKELVRLDTGSLDLRADTAVNGSLLRGWSFAEAEGRWTDGAEAALALRTSSPVRDLAIDVMGVPMLHPGHPALEVEIWANDLYVDTWAYRLEEAAPPCQRVVLPREALERSDVLEIGFVFREPCRPMALGLSEDHRKLGLFVSEVRFSHA